MVSVMSASPLLNSSPDPGLLRVLGMIEHILLGRRIDLVGLECYLLDDVYEA